jgi:DNA-binding transcriptional MerR regulator
MASNNVNQQVGQRLLTRREVAELFGVAPITVRRWEEKGILTPIRVNERIVRYHPDEVTKLMEGSA